MSHMFSWCSSLNLLPDISKCDTSKVTNMEYMFSYCYSLNSLNKKQSNSRINQFQKYIFFSTYKCNID